MDNHIECKMYPLNIKQKHLPRFKKTNPIRFSKNIGDTDAVANESFVIVSSEESDMIVDDATAFQKDGNSEMLHVQAQQLVQWIHSLIVLMIKSKLKWMGLLARAIYGSGAPLSMVENPLWISEFAKLDQHIECETLVMRSSSRDSSEE